jgi:F420H(2)-dependent quinone reductase
VHYLGANAFHRTMRAFAATKVGAALFRPTAHHLDQLVSKLTGGKRSLAGIAAGIPAVILTTAGAKSGTPRTVALLGVPHPDGPAVIAPNYGGAKKSQSQPSDHGVDRGRYLACHRPTRHTPRAR